MNSYCLFSLNGNMKPIVFTYTNHSRLTVSLSGLFAKYYAEFD